VEGRNAVSGGRRRWCHRHAISSLLARCIITALTLTAVQTASASVAGAATRSAAPGSIGVRLMNVPVNELNDPRARIYIVDHLGPGMDIQRQIEVSNTTNSTLHVVMYSAAATIANGSFLGAAGHTGNDLSSWTSVSPDAANLRAGGTMTATVSIAVPLDAVFGEQYGVVWAEVRSDPIADGGITQVSRVGIRIYLSVGLGGPPESNFTINSLTAERSSEGQPIVLATVHNSGALALDLSGTLRLSAGPGALSAGPFPATLGTTLGIGETEPVSIILDKQVPAGPWDAKITLQSGVLQRSAQATITFPASGASLPVKTTPIRPGWSHLAIIGLFTLLLVGMTVLLVMFTRLRRRSRAVG
jgi:hypothetical protein